MPMIASSIPALLRERASLQPNDTAFSFVDYERDWSGVTESLTWSQLNRRVMNVAKELRLRGSTGDRAVILAPQGLDYITAFLGALEAGIIAVPLSVPHNLGGAHDERVESVLRDTSPSLILTTSAVTENVAEYAKPQAVRSVPSLVEIDLLDLDSRSRYEAMSEPRPDVAYLQYTSGSTRQPAGVMISNKNLLANFNQITSDYFVEYGKVAPPDTTVVSWLPFYHDMGMVLGICFPIMAGLPSVLTSPTAFLQNPARWVQLLAKNSRAFSAAPNFAFELTARRTADEDVAGCDLGDVLTIINGSERIHPPTLQRFAARFAGLNLHPRVIRPSYGLAEGTVYVATRTPAEPPAIVHFDSERLSVGQGERCGSASGTPLISYGVPKSQVLRIVDPDTRTECPDASVGEIWLHGDNVAMGYWQSPETTARTFGARLAHPSSGTPEGPWLRTGDQGFLSEGELFIIGRIKDLLIIYGRNHSPDDIEATIQEITRGRCAAISVPDDHTEKLVAIVELKDGGHSPDDVMHRLGVLRSEVTSAISKSHGLTVADLVLVQSGSIPITTSGKVRRAACVEQYRQDRFARLDV